MYLYELIEYLERQPDHSRVIANGFARPHSYRGYYDQLAFEPAPSVTIGSMLAAAKSAIGKTFIGWKGGEFVMDKWTPVWIAVRGDSGHEISPPLLDAMFGKAEAALAAVLALVRDKERIGQIMHESWCAEMRRQGKHGPEGCPAGGRMGAWNNCYLPSSGDWNPCERRAAGAGEEASHGVS